MQVTGGYKTLPPWDRASPGFSGRRIFGHPKKLQAEREAGKLLAEMEKHPGIGTAQGSGKPVPFLLDLS